jgi:hypothetical protein
VSFTYSYEDFTIPALAAPGGRGGGSQHPVVKISRNGASLQQFVLVRVNGSGRGARSRALDKGVVRWNSVRARSAVLPI